MKTRLPLLVRTAMYALRGGFLVRPLLISLALGLTGMILSSLEESYPVVSAWVPHALFPSRADPQIAQIMLAAIAGSIMTVVSIVFAILLMTLTLASMQFSPRILVSFVRDRITQWTLGVFLGTFLYCMAALPAARSLPQPFAPVASVTGALVLALTSVIGLIFFIHHISQAVSVSHIVDRIARETEDVIDEIMPHKRGLGLRHEDMTFAQDGTELPVLNEQSGDDRRRATALANLLSAFQHSLTLSAGAVQNLPNTQAQTASLLSASQSSVGILQATQAGNQLVAVQTRQLADLTALLAAQGRAQALEAARKAEAEGQAQEQLRRFLSPGQGYQPQTVQMFH